jgi:hypothetical protein
LQAPVIYTMAVLASGVASPACWNQSAQRHLHVAGTSHTYDVFPSSGVQALHSKLQLMQGLHEHAGSSWSHIPAVCLELKLHMRGQLGPFSLMYQNGDICAFAHCFCPFACHFICSICSCIQGQDCRSWGKGRSSPGVIQNR